MTAPHKIVEKQVERKKILMEVFLRKVVGLPVRHDSGFHSLPWFPLSFFLLMPFVLHRSN